MSPKWWLLLLALGTPGCTAPSGGAPAATAPTSASVGSTTVVAVQPASQPPCSLWQFLGVPGAAKGVCKLVTCIESHLGTLFPGLEPGPALLPISALANLQSSNPAVASAAAVKADEDAAPQKIKAIEYLATIGCGGCYPEVQDALLAALDDCTESVRFAAVTALRSTACGNCKVCRKKACCSPKVMAKLHKVAYDINDEGCYKEPSPRVRRVARLAMAACGCGVPAPAAGTPEEGPTEAPAPAPAPAEAPPKTAALQADVGWQPAVHTALPPAAVQQSAAVRQSAALEQSTPAQPPATEPLASRSLPPTASPPVTPSSAERTADNPQAPVAVAMGIEPLPPDGEASAPAVPAGQSDPQVQASSAGNAQQGQANGPVSTVENQRANRSKVILNPFVSEQSSPAKGKVQLASGEQAVDGQSAKSGAGVRQANWNPDIAASQTPLTGEQLHAYYQQHLTRYQGSAEARWEWIQVRFTSFASKVDAYAAAAALRQAAVEGELAHALALYPQTEIRAFDWTPADRIPSHSIARALGQLRPGEVSVMMENAAGVDVVRLLEKRWRPLGFEEAQELVRRDMLDDMRRPSNSPPSAPR